VKESNDPIFMEEFQFQLLDGKIPVNSKGRIERIYVGVWNHEKNTAIVGDAPPPKFIGGVSIGTSSLKYFLLV
jgi:hypothetical protein